MCGCKIVRVHVPTGPLQNQSVVLYCAFWTHHCLSLARLLRPAVLWKHVGNLANCSCLPHSVTGDNVLCQIMFPTSFSLPPLSLPLSPSLSLSLTLSLSLPLSPSLPPSLSVFLPLSSLLYPFFNGRPKLAGCNMTLAISLYLTAQL